MKKFLITLIKVVIFFVGWAVCGAFGEFPSDNPAVWRLGAEFFPFIWCLVFTMLFWMIDKRTTIIPIFKNGIKSLLGGTLIGIIWIGICTGVLLLMGTERITGSNHVDYLWIWIISAFINTVMQEVLVRGYIYQLVKKEYSVIPVAVVTTAIFTLVHGGAFEAGMIPVINVITMSLFATALYEYYGNLIAPIMAHAIWNIIGAIVFGAVSLADDYPNIFNMISTGNSILSGGDYMIEGSIIVLIVNILLMIVFISLTKKKLVK